MKILASCCLGLALGLTLAFGGAALTVDEARAEGAQANNTVYGELGGPGLIYSINYERRIFDFNLRVGAGGAAFDGSGYAVFPIGFNYMGIGDGKHHLELGATGNIFTVFGSGTGETAFILTPIVGYRLQPDQGGFNFRAGLSPYVFATGEGVTGGGFIPMPYVSFGASF
jgi:hypothetical protein